MSKARRRILSAATVTALTPFARRGFGAGESADDSRSEALVMPGPQGLSVLSPSYRRLYGPGLIVIDRLAYNYVRRNSDGDHAASHRFRAPSGGWIESVRFYAPEGLKGEYAAGTGGRVSVRVFPDDGTPLHHPLTSGRAIAEGVFMPDMHDGEYAWRDRQFPQIPLTSVAPLQVGMLYHVLYEQVGKAPDSDFVNINNTATNQMAGRPARWMDPTDWASLYGVRAAGSESEYRWSDATTEPYSGLYYVPILQVSLKDGTRFGSSVMESGNVEGRLWDIGRGQPVRERFFSATSRRISGFSVATACDGPAQLDWKLSSCGRDLSSGQIREPAGNYRTIKSYIYQQGLYRWYDVALTNAVEMPARQYFDLTFEPRGDSRWRFAVQRNGCAWGFEYPAAFSHSQAQFQLDGRWTAAYMWDHQRFTSDRSNWRVVLHTV